MTIAGELINVLGFRLEGQENLKRFNQGMDDAADSAERTSKRLAGFGKAAGVVGGAMVAAGIKGIKAWAPVERRWTLLGNTLDTHGAKLDDIRIQTEGFAQSFGASIEDATTAMETLAASGLSAEDALAFLPAVLAGMQGSGSAPEDIANSLLKVSSALGLTADQADIALDIMVAGGKAGQFELKNMAQYLPNLANGWAALGYTGEEGLTRLVGALQVLRARTGDASTAATQMDNVIGKIFSPEVIKRFSEVGIDLPARLQEAVASGEDLLDAFTRLSSEAVNGDLSKLPQIFGDKEMRDGVRNLIVGRKEYNEFADDLSSRNVEGTALKDLNAVLDDTQTRIQRAENSWAKMWETIGRTAAPPAAAAFDNVTNDMARKEAIQKWRTDQGYSWLGAQLAPDFMFDIDTDEQARRGGYIPIGDPVAVEAARNAPDAYKLLGRRAARPVTPTPTSVAPSLPAASPFETSSAPSLAGAQSYDGLDARMNEIAGMIQNGNQNLANMVGNAAIEPVITDARTDARTFPVSVSTTVNQQIQQPSAAPGAVGQATGAAVASAVQQQASRLNTEPAN